MLEDDFADLCLMSFIFAFGCVSPFSSISSHQRPSTQMSLDATEDSDGHMHHPRIASMFDIMPGFPPLCREGTLCCSCQRVKKMCG